MNTGMIIATAIIIAALATVIIEFVKLPNENKIANVKEWLKYAVTEAEKALGSGTGQLKLRWVYDLAVKQFPWISQLVTFETFSGWVDEALEWMNNQISTNEALSEYVSK